MTEVLTPSRQPVEVAASATGASAVNLRLPPQAASQSSSPEPRAAIAVSGLSKLYKIYSSPSQILKELIVRRPLYKPHWALRDVSFTVKRGEIVGVVGANGAGKSTLLRILAGTLDHTQGSFRIAAPPLNEPAKAFDIGRRSCPFSGGVRAILQLGTGFHEEYTGRENIFMGGYCLGYTKAEIEESIDWIIDFSGLGHVIDQPFRTYSSGMKSRLTFAVTFCRRPDILIVDEALATGDLAFQQKCTNHILDLCTGGATALVVSHSMFFIETLCSRSLYLRRGELAADGPSREITEMYEKELLAEFAKTTVRRGAGGAGASGDSGASAAGALGDSGAIRGEDAAARGAPPPVDEDDPSIPPPPQEIQALLDDPEDRCPPILHLNLVRLVSVRVLDAKGEPRDRFHTGEPVTVEITVDSSVRKDNVAIGVQIFNEADIHVLTSTNLTQLNETGRPSPQRLNLRRGRQVFRVEFPRLFLCDGKYHVGVGIAPKARHFTPADQLLRRWRVASLGFYRDDLPFKQIYDPPSRWSKAAHECPRTA